MERLKGLLSSKGAQGSSKGTSQRGQSQSRAASSQAGNFLLAEINLCTDIARMTLWLTRLFPLLER